MTKPFDLLRRQDVISIIEDYKINLLKSMKQFPKDLSLQHGLHAAIEIEHHIKLMTRGGLVVIQDGLNKE